MKVAIIVAATAASLLIAGPAASAQLGVHYAKPKKPKVWNTFQAPAKSPAIPKTRGPAQAPGLRGQPGSYVYAVPGVADRYAHPRTPNAFGATDADGRPCSSSFGHC